ncbi:MAG: hypothetical protein HDT42_06160 [Ruminococcaceae bacterium]|nr:hypothetical protein [Oscillospiraceae bacterium]
MAEYIERTKAITKVKRRKFSGKNLAGHELSFNDGISETVTVLESIPAADVRPERHGRWLYCGDGYECSECGGDSRVSSHPFCWRCSAKMDGKDVRK